MAKKKAVKKDIAKEIRKKVDLVIAEEDIAGKRTNEAIAKTDDDCMARYDEKDSFK